MVKVRIEYDRDKCIGAGVCAAVDPTNFEMNEDGKADLLGGKKEGDIWVKELEVDSLETIKTGAEGCPVLVIKVIDKDKNETIVGGG